MRNYYPNLPLIQERFTNHIKEDLHKNNINYGDYEIEVFAQTWGSTALGFGGIGGQAITRAYTTVIWEDLSGIYGVFFNEGLGYVIQNPNRLFFEDMANKRMAERSMCNKYRRPKE